VSFLGFTPDEAPVAALFPRQTTACRSLRAKAGFAFSPMNKRRLAVVVGLLAALSSFVRAQRDESPVVLDPYEVRGYLENYAAGDSFTALRVNAPLLEVPLSTSIITSALLADQGLTDINVAIRNIAGAQAAVGGSEFQNYFFTRGMPNFYYRDGVRMELAGGNITPNVAAIENIEVLKGPSSILYGRGTPGGIVNFVSKRPLTQSRQLVQASVGDHDQWRADLDVTGSAGGPLAYRLIATREETESERAGVTQEVTYLNPSVLYAVSADTQVYAQLDYADQQLIPDTGIAVRPDGRLPAWADASTVFTRSFNTVTPRTAGVDYDSLRAVAELTSRIGAQHQLRVAATRMRFNHNGSGMAMNMLDSAASGVPGMLGPNQLLRVWNTKTGRRDVTVLRVEDVIELSQAVGTATVEHQLLVALEYGQTDADFTQGMQDHEIVDLGTRAALPVWQYFALFGLGTTRDGQLIYEDSREQTKGRDLSLSLQDNIKLSETWRLLVGLRYEENKAELDGTRENFIIGAMPAPMSSRVVSAATKGRLLPRVGVLCRVQPDLSLFANYLTSFIPAGGTQTGPNGVIAPETGDQLEAGVKVALLSNRLFATASVFRIQRDHIATFYQDPVTFSPFWKATDSERSTGAEFELTGEVAPGFSVVGHIGLIDNEFTGTDLAPKLGRTRHGLSRNTASLWAVYAPVSGAAKGLRLGAGAFYSGPQFLEDYNTVELGGRTVCDALAAYTRGLWSVQLNVLNLFDRAYHLPSGNGYNDPAYSAANYNSSVQSVMPGPGRTWRVKLSWTF